MRVLIITLTVILSFASVKAQQLPVFNLFHINPHLYNPAEAGNDIDPTIFTGYRHQWAGFEGAPKTYFINGSIELSDQLNLGMKIINDKVNVLNTTRIHFTYAYKLVLSKESFFKFGIEPGIHIHNVNLADIKASDFSDDIIAKSSQSASNFDVSFGLHYNYKALNLSIALPYMLTSKAQFEGTNDAVNTFQQAKHSIGYVSYLFSSYKSLWAFEPIIGYRYSEPSISQWEAIGKTIYDQKYFIALGYRKEASVNFSAGVKMDNNITIAYSYGQPNSSISAVSGGSHELLIGYTFGDKNKKIMPRYVYDKDIDARTNTKKKEKEIALFEEQHQEYHPPKAIIFDYQSDSLNKDYNKALNTLAAYLKRYPEKVLKLSPFYNNLENANGEELSITRMHKIRTLLISKGVPEHQIKEAHHPIHTHYGQGRIRLHVKH